MKEFTVLTGDRPTGRLHLGHYVGSIQNRVILQDQHQKNYYMVADIQALTDNADNPKKVRDNVFEVVLDNLACGLDPEKTTFFIQSQIPQIAELTVLFLNLVTVAALKRNPTIKSEVHQKGYGEAIPAGFLCYPISQAADILCVKSNLIPVGEDQLPVIEQANDIVEKFNRLYSIDLFPKITPLVGNTPRLVGIDGSAKASKSLNNAIYLSDSPEEIKRKVFSMYTDPNHIHISDPGLVEGNVVFQYLDIFNPHKEEVAGLKEHYAKGGLGDVVLKNRLVDVLNDFCEPIREKRLYYEAKIDFVVDIIYEGTQQVRKQAENTMQEVREALKISYL